MTLSEEFYTSFLIPFPLPHQRAHMTINSIFIKTADLYHSILVALSGYRKLHFPNMHIPLVLSLYMG